jgi:LmbE family N-acetylglucosaminyl deacetylase
LKHRTLVIAPHPDDEVLGVGGTMARLAEEGSEVHVLVVTKAGPPLFDEDFVRRGREEAIQAHALLGVQETHFLSLPAASLDTIPHHELNGQLLGIFEQLCPDTVFIPFGGDIHLDHQNVFLSALVASRPKGVATPGAVYAYETLSETNWNAPYLAPSFVPNTFVDVTEYLERKLEAMRRYSSQVQPFPHERSIEALQALATLRGSTAGFRAAEAFVLIRQLVRAFVPIGLSLSLGMRLPESLLC